MAGFGSFLVLDKPLRFAGSFCICSCVRLFEVFDDQRYPSMSRVVRRFLISRTSIGEASNLRNLFLCDAGLDQNSSGGIAAVHR